MSANQFFRAVFVAVVTVVAILAGQPGEVQAASLQIRPLQYRESLKAGESKKGFVDVSNSSATSVSVELSLQAFRQIDNGERLQFYDSETIRRGILLDLTEVDLGPQEAVRVYFVIRGDILPQGDIFAAIFATTRTEASEGIAPSARVGTLVIIENTQPGPRQADVTAVRTSLLQFGETINGVVTLRNTADPNKPSGFNPKVQLSLRPIAGTSQRLDAPLIMAGVSRDVPFDLLSNRVGLYRLTAVSGDSSASKWVLLVTGYWRWVVLGLLALGGVLAYIYRDFRRRRHRFVCRASDRLPGATELQAMPVETHSDPHEAKLPQPDPAGPQTMPVNQAETPIIPVEPDAPAKSDVQTVPSEVPPFKPAEPSKPKPTDLQKPAPAKPKKTKPKTKPKAKSKKAKTAKPKSKAKTQK